MVFFGMGFELVGLILASLYFGNMLDEKFQLKGLCLVALSMASLAGWLIHIVQLAKRIEKQKDE